MFVPIGWLLQSEKKWKLVIPVLLSLIIEILQLLTMRGLFEFDDVLNNSLGAFIGWLISCKLGKKNIIGILSLIAIISCCVFEFFSTVKSNSDISRFICFQIDENGYGYAFRPGYKSPDNFKLFLKNTNTGKIKHIDVQYNLDSKDVCDYFGDEYNGVRFLAQLPSDEEYEIYVEFNPLLSIPTKVYVSPNGIHYIPEKETDYPDIDAPFVNDGVLLVCNSDNHCWVYQYEGYLYWVADQDFYFEDDGTTFIQYQLWTTQVDRLPYKRIDNGWDNISCVFERYEIEGYFPYRVMKRELPTDYPITYIETGYYTDGVWVWNEYFRPVLFF